MTDVEDTVSKFRRNLLVFCVLVIVGVYLGIPLAAVLEKIFGVPVAGVSPLKLSVVQGVAFLYLVHRYYFATPTSGAVQQIREQINGSALSKRYPFVLGEIELSNTLGFPAATAFSHRHEDLVGELNKWSSQDSVNHVSANDLLTRLGPPTQVNEWRYVMTPVLHNRVTGNQFASMESLGFFYEFTRSRKIYFYFLATLKTLFAGSALTEHLVPFLAVMGAAVVMVYKFYVLIG